MARKMFIQLKQGLLEGGEDTSLTTGKPFCTFYGIPYAEPPVGDLRFRPPIPAGKWSEVRNAKNPRDWCLQKDMITGDTGGSEDCLFINIFTSEFPNPKASPKPVMVHFCGGGYQYANENLIGSFDHLADYDVIMVTLSHRLHIFGYLNLNTPSCAGNCGCKDIVLGLKWIKNNIREFGGDPNNVTIYGESTGAGTVSLLSLSPMAKGLFEKAIISSGNALARWAFHDDQLDVGFAVGRSLGFTGTNVKELATFLRGQPAAALRNAAVEHDKIVGRTHTFYSDLVFTPSLEKFSENAFLCDYPVNLVKTAHPIPTMAGVAEKDGVIITLALEYAQQLLLLKDNLISEILKFKKIPYRSRDLSKVVREAKLFYLSGTKTDEDIESRLLDFYSDLMNIKFYESFEYVTKSNQPLYVFQFNYIGSLNESKFWASELLGRYAGHGDEKSYVNLCRGYFPNPHKLKDADKEMIRMMCSLYTNFAKTGNPNPDLVYNKVEWRPSTVQKPCYFKIDSKSEVIEGKICEEGRAFWEHIRKNYSH